MNNKIMNSNKRFKNEHEAEESHLKKKVKRLHKMQEYVHEREKMLCTISVAISGSLLNNITELELKTRLVGKIARHMVINRVDEIIIFDDNLHDNNFKSSTKKSIDTVSTVSHSCLQMGRILQYLECPQYLRKIFFPLHEDLKYAGMLAPLNIAHHLRINDVFTFR